jgi:hypothetical protein
VVADVAAGAAAATVVAAAVVAGAASVFEASSTNAGLAAPVLHEKDKIVLYIHDKIVVVLARAHTQPNRPAPILLNARFHG